MTINPGCVFDIGSSSRYSRACSDLFGKQPSLNKGEHLSSLDKLNPFDLKTLRPWQPREVFPVLQDGFCLAIFPYFWSCLLPCMGPRNGNWYSEFSRDSWVVTYGYFQYSTHWMLLILCAPPKLRSPPNCTEIAYATEWKQNSLHHWASPVWRTLQKTKLSSDTFGLPGGR